MRRYKRICNKLYDARQLEARLLASGGTAKDGDIGSLRLSELAELWYTIHGASLATGKSRYSKILHLSEQIGDPLARNFTAQKFSALRSLRQSNGIRPNTLNKDLTYLHQLFSALIKSGHWRGANPLADVARLKVSVQEMAYLDFVEIRHLLSAAEAMRSPNLYNICKLGFSTGARWSEALTVRVEHIRNGLVTFPRTKNGRPRSVPVTEALAEELLNGQPRRGRLFTSDPYKSFAMAIRSAGIILPAGQNTHIMRHTFASHYVMAGGNILSLQKLLGHSSLEMTMRYAHLAPEHLSDAKRLNPIAQLRQLDANRNQ